MRDTRFPGTLRGTGCSHLILQGRNVRLTNIIFSAVLTDCILGPRSDRGLASLDLHCLGLITRDCASLMPGNGAVTSVTVPTITSCYKTSIRAACLLMPGLQMRLTGGPRLCDLLASVRVPLRPILTRVRAVNIQMSTSCLRGFSGGLRVSLTRVRGRTCRTTKRAFGLTSPGRLDRLFFRGLNLSGGGSQHGGSNNCSASTTALRGLRNSRTIISLIMRRHALSGLGSACMSTLPLLVQPSARHIRASFGRTMATANQLSSSGPGLRGVPVQATFDQRVQTTFVPTRN